MLDLVFGSAPFVVVLAVAIVGFVAFLVGRMRHTAKKRLMERYGEANILLTAEDANLTEHLSTANRTRGNGVLVLTSGELAFEGVDSVSLRIPLESIGRVEQLQITVGGKPVRPLLRVYYTNRDGEQDIAGWLVAAAREWTRQIEQYKA